MDKTTTPRPMYLRQASHDLTDSCILCGRDKPELTGYCELPTESGFASVTYGICEACKALPESTFKAEAAVVSRVER